MNKRPIIQYNYIKLTLFLTIEILHLWVSFLATCDTILM